MLPNRLIGVSPEQLFWRKVVFAPSGCWEWKAGLSNGYGVLSIKGRAIRAHRWAYEKTFGPIAPGLLVMHRCDNRKCVRVAHLDVGTYTDNNRDMTAKGRHHYSRKTHCVNGHEFTPENTCRETRQRRCRVCRRARQVRYYAQRKERT